MGKKEAGKTWNVGIDVSAKELVVATISAEQAMSVTSWSNCGAGHEKLIQYLRALRGQVRVCLEASGNYSLDIALALSRAGAWLHVSVVNPRCARRFAESLGKRSKTDPVDAQVLAEYAARMPLEPWSAPSANALKLRALTRTIAALVRMCTQHKNRQHALEVSEALPAMLVSELARQQGYTEKRIARLRRQAVCLVEKDAQLAPRYRHLLTIPGVGEATALAVLAEVAVLPDTLDERQWVAYSGLDPRHHVSGSSVEQKPRISKAGNRQLRAALYMSALVAVQHDPALRGFYQRLVGRGKPKLVAIVAVMRKLLHAAWGMFRHDQDYDGGRLCPQL